MANKPQGKSWNEVQMAITAVAITATLGLWNMFATPEKTQAAAQITATFTPPEPPPPAETAIPEPTATAVSSLALRPVKIIYGGIAPQQPVVQVAAAGQVAAAPAAKKNKSGGASKGGGVSKGGGGNPAPVPPPTTGTSKP
jgi:hypothetical protein